MFGYEYDAETGGLLLNDSTPNSSKEPRPVYAAEMRMLHMDEWFTFTDQDDSPYMWAEAASYYYRGQLVARTKGGSLCEAPVMDYLVAAAESGEKVPAVPQGYALQPVDIDHNSIYHGVAMGYSSSTKFQDKIKGFNERFIMVLIGHIERYLTKVGIDMGLDDKVVYNVTVHKGQAIIATDNASVNTAVSRRQE